MEMRNVGTVQQTDNTLPRPRRLGITWTGGEQARQRVVSKLRGNRDPDVEDLLGLAESPGLSLFY